MKKSLVIYKKIRAIRIMRGYSQEAFAFDLGISVNSYWKIENGKTDLNFSRLMQIIHLLGFPTLLDFISFDYQNFKI